MRKYLILCIMAVLGLSAFAIAEVTPGPSVRGDENVQLNMVDRTGSCVLTTLAPSASINSFGWDGEDAYGAYIDAATDGDGGCTPAFYPFLVTSVDVPLLFFFGAEEIGFTVTYHVGIYCPKDDASPGISESCKGPGAEICGVDVTYTVNQTDFDANPDMFVQNVPLTCCVSGPFYVIASFVSYDGTVGVAPTPAFDLTVGGPTTEPCDAWFHFFLGGTPDWCWFPGSFDFGCGATCFPGDVALFVNGEAGATCEPATCTPCNETILVGDVAENPIVIDAPSWTQTVDLCRYCSDYDALNFGIGTRTQHGPDAVLAFSSIADPTCFNITLTPACEVPTFFRLRSWLESDIFGVLYAGTPNFPGLGGGQTYNFSGNGAPDDLGCWFPDNYRLYIDSRQFCCCPVVVSFNGDNALAVEITSFAAIAGDGKVTVNWNTNAESDIEYFEINRNGEFLTEVTGLGDSPTGHSYSFVDNNVTNGSVYSYQLTAYDVNGAATVFGQIQSATPMAGAGIVTDYVLKQNFPNPFNPTTNIQYTVRELGNVELKVYSVDGREVATLVSGMQEAGSYTVDFDASGLASGMYMYKMSVNGFTATQKMVLMK